VIEMINQYFEDQEWPQSSKNFLHEEIMKRVRLTGINFDLAEIIGNFLENNNRHLPMYASKTNQGEDLPENQSPKT
jgi:hypothetical protein